MFVRCWFVVAAAVAVAADAAADADAAYGGTAQTIDKRIPLHVLSDLKSRVDQEG